jgi:hypothetical protein
VVKSSRDARLAYVERDGRVPAGLLDAVTGSEDAFDATISALEMSRQQADFAQLRPEPGYSLEGAIWNPAEHPSAQTWLTPESTATFKE